MTALVERPKAELSVSEWGTMKEQASMMIKTGFLPPAIKTPEQVIAIALTGRELGIGMMEAIRGINVIQGKPSVSPQLMLALAIRTGQMESYSMKAVDRGAEVVIKRKGWPEHRVVFGPIEAKALGLDSKDNYRKQPHVMYKWRALAEALRFTFPDAVSGIYTPDELGAEVTLSDEGEISISKPLPPAVDMPKEKSFETAIIEEEVDDNDQLPLIGQPISQITDAERKLLFKLAKDAYGPSYESGLRGYLKMKYRTEHTAELEPEQYRDTCAWLKEWASDPLNPNKPK